MAKKKKVSRIDAHNEMKSLESKWLKDHRLHGLEPIAVRVMAAKVAALIEYTEANDLDVQFDSWPPLGAEELVKLDESNFRQGLKNLQKSGVINNSFNLLKAAEQNVRHNRELDLSSDGGVLTYRCVKPGGVSLPERDEYIPEEQEVSYTEDDIGESSALQLAIANEWLIRVEK